MLFVKDVLHYMLIGVILLVVATTFTGCNNNQNSMIAGAWWNEVLDTGRGMKLEFNSDGSGTLLLTTVDRRETFSWSTSRGLLTKTFHSDDSVGDFRYLISADGSSLTIFYEATYYFDEAYIIFIRVSGD